MKTKNETYPDSAKSYGLGAIDISKTMLPRDEYELAQDRNAVLRHLHLRLKSGYLTGDQYRSMRIQVWAANDRAAVAALIAEWNKAEGRQ